MVFSDGFLAYPEIQPDLFIDSESLSWTNEGIIGVICDDPGVAAESLGSLIVLANLAEGRDVKVFNFNDGQILYLQVEEERFDQFNDKIHEYKWRIIAERDGLSAFPNTNELSSINPEIVSQDSKSENYIAVIFNSISNKIKSIDRFASEISMDYTYGGDSADHNSHIRLRRELSKYYIYNQDKDTIYDFKTFTR